MDSLAVDIDVVERSGFARVREGVGRGVPIGKGQLYAIDALELIDTRDQTLIPIQSTALAHWSDSSVKWLLIEFAATLDAGESARFRLQCTDAPAKSTSDIRLKKQQDRIELENDQLSIRIDTNTAELSVKHRDNADWSEKSVLRVEPCLSLDEGDPCLALRINEVDVREGPCKTQVTLKGVFRREDGHECLHYHQRLQLESGSNQIRLDKTLHNTRAARHTGGFWDLGDSRSVFIDAFGMRMTLPDIDAVEVRTTPDSPDQRITDPLQFALYQDSSGGDQWNHHNHVNHHGDVPVRFRGYQMTVAEQLIEEGHRATPIVSVVCDAGTLSGTLAKFWENFPSAINVSDDRVDFSCFPHAFADRFELQPGEKKTHSMIFSWVADKPACNDDLRWFHHPLCISVPPKQIERSRVIPFFSAGTRENPLEAMISRSLSGPGNFFEKRELIDEFGWRNFGEIVADHESMYELEQGEQPLVSHYNNQYDPIYGFGFQFLRTGEASWFELMDDLAAHVAHIDIYDTLEDRPEFNGGLFWHTEHYRTALTSSHRTYSRKHVTEETNMDYAGGGPGSEHCYATGLMLHYFLTGSEWSRNSVMSLANWMHATYVGAPGLLSQIDSLRKNELKSFKQWMRGDKTPRHRFPLSRATGNYINVLLDAYELSGDSLWLERAESAIRATVHPEDRIDARGLDDVEANWSYIVLLNAVARYLDVKLAAQALDASYHHARASLLHYAHWIAREETPYLSDLSRIEFPNDTWVAQEIRKVNILNVASLYEQEQGGLFRRRADEFEAYLVDNLSQSDTLHFARIQAILLQNVPLQNAFLQKSLTDVSECHRQQENSIVAALPDTSLVGLAGSVTRTLLRGIASFSPRHEYKWVMARLVSRSRS